MKISEVKVNGVFVHKGTVQIVYLGQGRLEVEIVMDK